MKRDGVGIACSQGEELLHYDEDCDKISSMCINKSLLYIASDTCITCFCLESKTKTVIVDTKGKECNYCVARYDDGVLYTDPLAHKVMQIHADHTLSTFAGDGHEGSLDGAARSCNFYQPQSLCVEFGNVVYVCDTQANCIKLISPMKETAAFLSAIGKLYLAFSVHGKGEKYDLKSLDEATQLVNECKETLDSNEYWIRQEHPELPSVLNGSHGFVASKSKHTVEMLRWGLGQLRDNLSSFGSVQPNLLSCLTLDVEHLHSTVHSKKQVMSQHEYARAFGNTMKEAAKRIVHWSAFYYTGRKSWYQAPSNSLALQDIPLISPLPVGKLDEQKCKVLRDWALTYGSAVRQRTVRQETTMSRMGTLPEFLQQRNCVVSSQQVDISGGNETDGNERGEDDVALVATEDHIEYDPSSDEDEERPEDDESVEFCYDNEIPQIHSAANFLIGRQSQFGRTIRINNRFLF